MNQAPPITIIGAGLAGSEAAWQLAQRGLEVHLYEMRPTRLTPAHQTGLCGELVCSNSLRSDDPLHNAVGLLHQELRLGKSLIMESADAHRVPAGSALAVDRQGFATAITRKIIDHPLIHLVEQELSQPPAEGWTIVATGPLTSLAMTPWLEEVAGKKRLAFYDALAPIVTFDSIDFSIAWKQSRYDRGMSEAGDYINCPLTRDEYLAFIQEVLAADPLPQKDFESIPIFEGCMPIEEMARRGVETLRFGPMKPVGLADPQGNRPWAVVQLRQDNWAGTLWNMVGFQTRLTWPDQKRIFAQIPGLQHAEFLRFGAMHRNTFIHSPQLLTPWLQLRTQPQTLFAGQITGVEGYVESTACGWAAGIFLSALIQGAEPPLPPSTTALGALLAHLRGEHSLSGFQPMNVNFGLFPPISSIRARKERKTAMAIRGQADFQEWIQLIEK